MKRLKEQRTKKHMTQKQLADHLHISRVAYCNYETGTRQPNYETLCELADFFGVNIEYLLERTEISDPFPVITKEELHLLKLYRQVDVRSKEFILDMIRLQASRAAIESKKQDSVE